MGSPPPGAASPPGPLIAVYECIFSPPTPPQHAGKQHMERILISTPTAPLHGAVAKLRAEVVTFPAL